MKHFLNSELLAPNVMTVPIDRHIVAEFARLDIASDDYEHVVPSEKWESDIRWHSAANRRGFDVFQSAFDRLNVADHVTRYIDVEDRVRLYAGFLVERSQCASPYFHEDWINANNNAFTLLTPVIGNDADPGLVYRRLDGSEGQYRYREGEAIIFGDGFEHATAAGRTEVPVTLLCFEFGTDKMEHWRNIKRTIGHQARLLQLPDGSFVRNDGLAGHSDRFHDPL